MIELYAVIGLASLDDEFREKLENSREGMDSIREVLKDYGFRLSLYEIGEVQRLMHIPEVIECMDTIYNEYWDEGCVCLTAMTPNDRYAHPTFYACRRSGSEKVAFSRTPDERKKAATLLRESNTAIRAAAKAAKAAKKVASAKKQTTKKSASKKK